MIEKSDNLLRISGTMLIADAVALLNAGRGCLRDSKAPEVLIDLSAVEETDSSALAVVFGWLRSAHEQGKTLRISAPPASMLSLAALYGVAESLPLVSR